MTCQRCRISMKEEKRVFHKRRKWICPKCGKVSFQSVQPKGKRDHD